VHYNGLSRAVKECSSTCFNQIRACAFPGARDSLSFSPFVPVIKFHGRSSCPAG
jgi:hypothetical protein